MDTIKVVAAIIKKENTILIAKRKNGAFAGMYEFPGGKIKFGETDKQALIREIQEELETTISVDKYFMNVNYKYPNFILLAFNLFSNSPISTPSSVIETPTTSIP